MLILKCNNKKISTDRHKPDNLERLGLVGIDSVPRDELDERAEDSLIRIAGLLLDDSDDKWKS